jgi:hypothetical protein
MITEISLAIKSLKAGLDIVKNMSQFKNDYEIKKATSELLDLLIDTQTQIFAIQSSY